MKNLNSPEPEDELDWMDTVALGRPSSSEVAARRRELAGRPAELRRLEQELALNAILDSRPGAPKAATNFAAQVLARITEEDRKTLRERENFRSLGWWRRWRGGRPAWVLATVTVLGLSFGWRVLNQSQRSQMAATVATVALTTSTPGLSAENLENYEIIRRLGAQAQPGDDALIAALVENPAP